MKNCFLSTILSFGAFLVPIGHTNAVEPNTYNPVSQIGEEALALHSESYPILSTIQLDNSEPNGPIPLSLGDGFVQQVQNDPYFKYKKISELVVWGGSIGVAGMEAVDIDGDGVLELLLSCDANYWYIVKYNQITGSYEIIWASEVYSESIVRLAVYEIGGKFFVFLGMRNGVLKIIDGESFNEISSSAFFSDAIYSIKYADADNDGSKELVACSKDSTIFFDPAISLGVPERTLPFGGYDMEIGDVDGDPNIEIVYPSGNVVEVSNDTVSVQWNFQEGFGYYIELTDVDSDGVNEIIGAAEWYWITCFDVDTKSVKWQHETDHDIDVLKAYDVDADGVREILYGDKQWGGIHCLDNATGQQIWEIPNLGSGKTDIRIADIDHDQRLEIFWSANQYSSGPDHFYVYDLQDRNQEWVNEIIDVPFTDIDSADLDGDGTLEWTTPSAVSVDGPGGGCVLYQINGLSNAIEWRKSYSMFNSSYWRSVTSVVAADYDQDNQVEILIGAHNVHQPRIYMLDPLASVVEKTIDFDGLYDIDRMKAKDIDGDGIIDLVVQNGKYIHIAKPINGAIEWTSTILEDWMSGFELGNIDGDIELEIVVPHGDLITVIDGVLRDEYTFEVDWSIRGLVLADVNADGSKDIICISVSGDIKAFSGYDYSEIEIADLIPGDFYVKTMSCADIDNNGVEELVIHVGDKPYTMIGGFQDSWLLIRRLDDFGMGYDIRISDLTYYVNNDRIHFADLDANGFLEMVLGTRRGWSVWSLEETNTIDPASFFQPLRQLSNGWRQSSWFGYYYDGNFPSVSHPILGKCVVRKNSTGNYVLNSSDWGELEIIQPGIGDAFYVRHEASRTIFFISPTNEELAVLGPGRFYDHTFGKWVDNIIPETDDYQRYYEVAEYLVAENQSISAEIVVLANGGQVQMAREELQSMIFYHSTIIDYCNSGLNAVNRLVPSNADFWRNHLRSLVSVAESAVVSAQQAIQNNS